MHSDQHGRLKKCILLLARTRAIRASRLRRTGYRGWTSGSSRGRRSARFCFRLYAGARTRPVRVARCAKRSSLLGHTAAPAADETQKHHAPEPVPALCIGTRLGDGARSTRRPGLAQCVTNARGEVAPRAPCSPSPWSARVRPRPPVACKRPDRRQSVGLQRTAAAYATCSRAEGDRRGAGHPQSGAAGQSRRRRSLLDLVGSVPLLLTTRGRGDAA
jgi:hypothetical protein